MPPLPGFSDNPLKTRDDVTRAAKSLIRPLLSYFSPAKARIRIPISTGTHFDETAAQLEGFARPLWAIAPLLLGGDDDLELYEPWIEGFVAGTDPEHPEYWGDIKDMDQRMVEAEMLAFALLGTPRHILWGRFSEKAKENLVAWFMKIQRKEMPPMNWLWFRVFVSLALLKVCGVEEETIRAQLEDDLNVLDSFYLTDGWSSDGIWRGPDDNTKEFDILKETGITGRLPTGRSADFYSGSFAIQFSQLLYIRFAADLDPERAQRYREQARQFALGFSRYFDSAGAVIPFGRSLTYRFACGAFWAALGFAEVSDLQEHLSQPGAVKGYLLRHLRWWAQRSDDIFNSDGTLNLGWLYPNMYMTEDYNSPQSVYWCLKAFLVVGLGPSHPFWTEKEASYQPPSPSQKLMLAPRQIVCNHPLGNHHFHLSPAQFLGGNPIKAAQAKYCKFAYSSSFSFSVPTGNLFLEQIAPDSSLWLTRDGKESWISKWKTEEPTFGSMLIKRSDDGDTEEVITTSVDWYPWADRSALVNTTLVPPSDRWPDWHVRIHRICVSTPIKSLCIAEGSFAINGRQREDSLALPVIETEHITNNSMLGDMEGILHSDDGVVVFSQAGASGIVTEVLGGQRMEMTHSAMKPEANTNLSYPRTLIPLAQGSVSNLAEGSEIIVVTKVFAISSDANGGRQLTGKSLKARWFDAPRTQLH
ncbi:hypothetical protein jhhlp_005347 [Lomentospora prolificans]|uniref:DUF2264 domain protein n=1 Tax=Lomentospora prolificans TaxID=41688 RepID=A0A2N3N7J1_9PEZI|nr:hypothetical protein jhhlp_005347 [Lomentospora prolificans]